MGNSTSHRRAFCLMSLTITNYRFSLRYISSKVIGYTLLQAYSVRDRLTGSKRSPLRINDLFFSRPGLNLINPVGRMAQLTAGTLILEAYIWCNYDRLSRSVTAAVEATSQQVAQLWQRYHTNIDTSSINVQCYSQNHKIAFLGYHTGYHGQYKRFISAF